MLPILLSLGPIKIYSYGLCLAIGLFIALYFWWKMGRDEHWDEISLFDGFFLSLITFFVAGRLGYVALHMEQVGTLYRTLAFLSYPGLNGVIGIAMVSVLVFFFARAQNWHVWKAFDAYVVALSVVLILAGLGGFLNGSTPGIQVSWGVMYPGESVLRVPIDLWTFVWALFTFAIVSRVRKNFRFYGWYKGEASVAQEGLATLVFGGQVGIYYLVAGWFMEGVWKWYMISLPTMVGLAVIILSLSLIRQRVGRRDTILGDKLKALRLNLLQWSRRRRG